jgi:hypothetical protein
LVIEVKLRDSFRFRAAALRSCTGPVNGRRAFTFQQRESVAKVVHCGANFVFVHCENSGFGYCLSERVFSMTHVLILVIMR